MNIFKLIEDIEKVDPEVYDRLDSRRAAFKNFAGFGKKLALTAVPVAFGAMFQKAYGQTADDVTDVLRFALTLEYLEEDFYIQGLAMPNLIPAADRPIFEQIRKHETAHVNFLKTALNIPAADPNKPVFDFSAGGTFPTWNTSKETYYALSQAFEDTGVRAYKGQAGRLVSNNDVLTAALQIHAVEARHAAEVRRLRGLKGWITGNDRGAGMPAETQAIYDGEELTTQANVNIAMGGISPGAASEAFDEPLSKETVLAIAGLFIVA